MEIRTLASSDFEAFLELEGYAFHAVVDERRREKAQKVWAHAVGLGAFSQEGALQSALLIHPHKVFLYGKTIGMGGIGDVASYPEARGQGNVRALMKESFRYMKDQQMLVSYLSPFSQSFYRKFGYELTFEERTYKISPSDFQALDTGDRTVRRVRWEDEKETLKRLYTQKYQQRIGPVNREDWAWEEKKRWHDDLHVALCVDEKGKAEGYAIYRFQSTRPYVFVVNELVALSGQAERALWQFIASHGPQFDHFKYKTGISNRLT
ncbi:GNAT family N-acetyltransferase, partial [Atopococcus tabaci]|uniref:GNAT family N-acetyltransferase n=1 Tax=Atopococcus tabaci TaxID=269774 RepID=UPI0024094F9F